MTAPWEVHVVALGEGGGIVEHGRRTGEDYDRAILLQEGLYMRIETITSRMEAGLSKIIGTLEHWWGEAWWRGMVIGCGVTEKRGRRTQRCS